MRNLLSAEFLRMFKSLTFKLCLLFSAGLGAFMVLVRWMDVITHPDIYAELGVEYRNVDGLIFVGGVYLIFAIAVFIGSFVGREYSDGTIRNKITAGHTRCAVYVSKFIVCAVADTILHGLYIIVVIALGNLLIGGTTFTVEEIVTRTIVSTMPVIAMTAFLLLFSMLIQSKAVGSVVCLLATVFMLFATIYIFQKLEAPEYYDAYQYIDENTGEIVSVEKEKNYNYLTGTKRKVYEELNKALPSSQLYQIAMNNMDNLGEKMFYNCLIVCLGVGGGTIIFRKKNLK